MKIILTVLASVIKSFWAKVWGKLSVAGGGKDNYSHKGSVDLSSGLNIHKPSLFNISITQ